jgi:hypothetical protein
MEDPMRKEMVSVVVAVALIMACGGDSGTTDGGTDGSVTGDSGKDGTTQSDANPGNDASGSDGAGNDGNGGSSIACGTGSCALPAESCCVDPGPPIVYACTGEAGPCAQGTASIKCGSAADCTGGQVCCIDGNVDPMVAACAATCTGAMKAMLCDPTATDAVNKCGDAGACGNTNINNWNLTTKYGTCGDI